MTPEASEANGPVLLDLRDISKAYGGSPALDKVSLTVRGGEVVGLLGDNGAGKSTLVGVISGVVQPDSGSLRWEGKQVSMRSRIESAELGIETIFQDSALVRSMSVSRNMFMGRELVGRFGFLKQRAMRDASTEILGTVVGIRGVDSPERLVGGLSGGQQQAVAIARAVYFKRKLLILDEPTSALAARATAALFEYIASLRKDGLSSILVTHDLYDAYQICDRFVILERGQVALNATRDELALDELIRIVCRG
ncbi:MAG TPA: ATP-binding cassette domain-containing protein [Acidimicrobiales bacterium]|nr:ATP-binding cassette domain-containing protein [Acidimicrobiales bacterium]